MTEPALQPLALVVQQAPYAQRSARAQLDFALAAATLELPLEIFFLGDAAWQLVKERESASAGLPRGLKGWAAIITMTRVSFFADADCVELIRGHGAETVVSLEGLDRTEIADRWCSCRQVVSI